MNGLTATPILPHRLFACKFAGLQTTDVFMDVLAVHDHATTQARHQRSPDAAQRGFIRATTSGRAAADHSPRHLRRSVLMASAASSAASAIAVRQSSVGTGAWAGIVCAKLTLTLHPPLSAPVV